MKLPDALTSLQDHDFALFYTARLVSTAGSATSRSGARHLCAGSWGLVRSAESVGVLVTTIVALRVPRTRPLLSRMVGV